MGPEGFRLRGLGAPAPANLLGFGFRLYLSRVPYYGFYIWFLTKVGRFGYR